MRTLPLIFVFSLLSIGSFAQNVHLSIVANGEPAIGVGIHVNGEIKTITNEQGKAQLHHLKQGDTIHTSYLGYKPETAIFSQQNKELNFDLIHEIHKIGEIKVSPINDVELFKSMLKWGLQETVIHKSTPFYLLDTLTFSTNDIVYRKCTGTFNFYLKYYQVSVGKSKVEILGATSGICRDDYNVKYGDGKKKLFENYKIPNRDFELCFGFLWYLCEFDRDYRLTYLGKDSTGCEQFYFSVSDNSWMFGNAKHKAHAGGMIHLNADGIIEKASLHKTSLDTSVESYEFDINYVYNEKSNEVIPYQATIRTYKLNEELRVVLTRNAHLEMCSKQALGAGIKFSNFNDL